MPMRISRIFVVSRVPAVVSTRPWGLSAPLVSFTVQGMTGPLRMPICRGRVAESGMASANGPLGGSASVACRVWPCSSFSCISSVSAQGMAFCTCMRRLFTACQSQWPSRGRITSQPGASWGLPGPKDSVTKPSPSTALTVGAPGPSRSMA